MKYGWEGGRKGARPCGKETEEERKESVEIISTLSAAHVSARTRAESLVARVISHFRQMTTTFCGAQLRFVDANTWLQFNGSSRRTPVMCRNASSARGAGEPRDITAQSRHLLSGPRKSSNTGASGIVRAVRRK